MRIMIEILLPIFCFILCGYGAGRFRLISDEGIQGIMTFVLYFAIPALLFRIVVNNELPGIEDLNVVLTYYSGCFVVFAISVLFGRAVFSLPLDQLGILGMGSMYSNSVLLGMPLVFTVFGEAGMIPILLIIAFHNVFLFPIVIVFIEIGRGRREAREGGIMPVLMSAFRGTIENPVIIALAISFLWAAFGLGISGPVDRFADLMGKAVAPAALFALGASMAGYKIAGAIAEDSAGLGGSLSAADLARYEAKVVPVAGASYRGARIGAAPGLSAGPTLLAALDSFGCNRQYR